MNIKKEVFEKWVKDNNWLKLESGIWLTPSGNIVNTTQHEDTHDIEYVRSGDEVWDAESEEDEF
jgi:hypothetical protein